MPVSMAVEGDERELIGPGDLAERRAAAEGRLEVGPLGVPAGGAAVCDGSGSELSVASTI